MQPIEIEDQNSLLHLSLCKINNTTALQFEKHSLAHFS